MSSLKKRPQALPAAPESSMFDLRYESQEQDRGPPGRSCRGGVDSYCWASGPQFPGYHPHPHINTMLARHCTHRMNAMQKSVRCQGQNAMLTIFDSSGMYRGFFRNAYMDSMAGNSAETRRSRRLNPLAMASAVPMDAKADTPKASARGRAITAAEMPPEISPLIFLNMAYGMALSTITPMRPQSEKPPVISISIRKPASYEQRN